MRLLRYVNRTVKTPPFTFPNGYKIEKYELTNEEVKVDFDKRVDPELGFR